MGESSFDEETKRAFRSDFRMLSVTADSRMPSDLVSDEQLPNPRDKAGGTCTSALLHVLYKDRKTPTKTMTWAETLSEIQSRMQRNGQFPLLSSSRMLDVDKPFQVVPKDKSGTRRAVLIGINYTGQTGELSACQKAVRYLHEYLTRVHGFEENNILILMDDGNNNAPTHKNILAAYRRLVKQSRAGDVVFCHYCGHGGSVEDPKCDRKSRYPNTLIPVDFESSGHVRDRDLFETLVCPMPAGVTVTFWMDCCHGGSVLQLPYRFQVNDTKKRNRMYRNQECNLATILGLTFAVGAVAGIAAATGGNEDAGGDTAAASTDAVTDGGCGCFDSCYVCELFCGCCEGIGDLFGDIG